MTVADDPSGPVEIARLQALRSYRILDSDREAGFDRITALAARLLQAPIALISLVDEERQWFKSAYGIEAQWSPRAGGFCAYTITCERPAVIPDAVEDPAFSSHPMVIGEPNIRMYAGAPLTTRDGYQLGTLCVIDTRPRTISAEELEVLTDLAGIAMQQIETRLWALRFAEEEALRLETERELAASRAAAEAQALRALHENARSRFLNVASHELRGPLTVLGGYLELLEAEPPRPGLQFDATSIMRVKVAQMNTLIDRMLAVARIDLNPGEWDRMDLGEVLQAEIDGLVPLNPSHSFQVDPPARRVLVDGDRRRLSMAFANLLDNAVKFSPTGGEVRVRFRTRGNSVQVTIRDQGIGIDAADLDHLFVTFGRLVTADNSAIGGPGLGLYLVRQLLAIHGGTVKLESDPGGTTALVTLPLRRRVETGYDRSGGTRSRPIATPFAG